ncbi:choice-of-anchor Q domain-containing protein [Xanthomonas sacchari]|uniref:choice-of-anchor Q domain-containing protein n=1 Tax=Xanthomonas sacchari TaxID=56458 RepID=UPI00225E51DF|nr:choice-of-anchor Q domain-containing protein [Xanthomonas sacchari]
MIMTTTFSLTTSARALGVFALMTAATAIAAVPAAPQCSVPQAWALPTTTTVVGNGTQASCTASALASAVAQGGYITFNCGAKPTSIAVDRSIVIAAAAPTVIDGQGKITLDGRQSARILLVNAGSALSVRNLKLQNGSSVQPASNQAYDPGTWGGGAIKVGYRGKLEVINSQFLANRSSIGGGAIFAGSDAEVTIVRSGFYKNSSWLGGALYTQLSRLTIVGSEFANNQAINAPQGFPDAGNFGGGGAIDTDGASLAGYLKGGVGSGGTLAVCGTVVRNNVAANGSGGATLWAYAPDTIDVKYSTFANNVATGGPGGGARISMGFTDTSHAGTAITTPGTINVAETSFLSNKAQQGNAGALYLDCYGACDVSNSTFYGNYAKGVGAAIQHVGWQPANGDQGSPSVRFNNVTFAENTPWVTLFGDKFDLRNSILYSKTERVFCNNQSNTGNNLIEYSAKGAVWPNACLAAGAVKAADPLLSAPANNGGPTLTQLPAANSPALNAGSGCAAIDQRGNPRNTAVCDLGAVEVK